MTSVHLLASGIWRRGACGFGSREWQVATSLAAARSVPSLDWSKGQCFKSGDVAWQPVGMTSPNRGLRVSVDTNSGAFGTNTLTLTRQKQGGRRDTTP
jgi:hypothetical protein